MFFRSACLFNFMTHLPTARHTPFYETLYCEIYEFRVHTWNRKKIHVKINYCDINRSHISIVKKKKKKLPHAAIFAFPNRQTALSNDCYAANDTPKRLNIACSVAVSSIPPSINFANFVLLTAIRTHTRAHRRAFTTRFPASIMDLIVLHAGMQSSCGNASSKIHNFHRNMAV